MPCTPSNRLVIPIHQVKESEIAELTKIIENVDRYLQMAFAKDLYLYCQANNINFPELRDALNTQWNVNILEPRDEIGGSCLPKDTKMFPQSSNFKILREAMKVDKRYREFRCMSKKDTNLTNTVKIGKSSCVTVQWYKQTLRSISWQIQTNASHYFMIFFKAVIVVF